jgi:hypothetical protein
MGRYQFQFSKQAQKDITQLTAFPKTKPQSPTPHKTPNPAIAPK